MIDSASESTDRISQISDIDIHNLLHPEYPRHEQAPCDDHHDDAVCVLSEQTDVTRVDGEHVERDAEGQEAQHPGREPPLRGEHLDLPSQHRPFAERVSDGIEDLGEISADLPLDVHRQNRPLEVRTADALGQTLQCILSRPAQSDLGHHPLELRSRGLSDLLRDRVERLKDTVPGAQRRRHDRWDVGQLFAETVRALRQRRAKQHRRERCADTGQHERKAPIAQERGSQHAEHERAHRGCDDELTRAQGDARGLELGVESLAEPARFGEPRAELRHVVWDPAAGRRSCRRRLSRLFAGLDDGSHPRLAVAILLLARGGSQQEPRQQERNDPHADPDEDLNRLNAECEHETPFGSNANSSGSTYTPRSASLSRNFGRRPVDFSRPRKRPSSSTPGEKSNRKMSCNVMTSPSMPATSVTCVKRRVPSFRRAWYTISCKADAICSRIALFDSSMPAIIVIVSSRDSASRGLLQWIVEIEPSWPVFIA